ncbi:MAG TPA: hypothetical protein VHW42_03510 [Actinomycetes bacterium]|nr:hypothetical protein [Actinomycetes bacterium]
MPHGVVIALELVGAVLILAGYTLGQLATRPAPDRAPPAPQGPVTPPIQIGTPSGPPRAE